MARHLSNKELDAIQKMSGQGKTAQQIHDRIRISRARGKQAQDPPNISRIYAVFRPLGPLCGPWIGRWDRVKLIAAGTEEPEVWAKGFDLNAQGLAAARRHLYRKASALQQVYYAASARAVRYA